MVETRQQIREGVAKELSDLANHIETKLEKLKQLGDQSAVNLATFMLQYVRDASKEWTK